MTRESAIGREARRSLPIAAKVIALTVVMAALSAGMLVTMLYLAGVE